ncbi:hypothetical protein TNCV_2180861 [Trichonephila clavipes]|uniref:Uncharacterized protein n=1 Tax=Trichonephila clavipes TaxID=2585209 RepID=A0A8X6VUT9_TRICX|nr:hypothetical protein TNCV_2180861 [Trichonephila clavipes]
MKPFLDHFVNGDEKWKLYKHGLEKKVSVCKEEIPLTTSKARLQQKKVVLFVRQEKIGKCDRRNYQKQREFESQEQHVTRVTEQCDRYHESQGQRIERLAQLREIVSAIRQAETNFDRERHLFTSRQTTSALRDVESEENQRQ